MEDLKKPDLAKVNKLFNAQFGNSWPAVPLRRWEYCSAALFSGVVSKPGMAIDVGCGRSVFPRFLAGIGCKDVYAADPCIGINENKAGVCYRKMSMTNISFEDGFFDYVFAISSIEHINAGKFKIEGMEFDTGDTEAMLELCRIVKPGGILVLTTDFAPEYYPPPGMWPSRDFNNNPGGSHRIYNWLSLCERLIHPAQEKYNMEYYGGISVKDFPADLKNVEPKGYDYTEMILTMRKPK
jgi:SAM-dependent methyltransferase